MASTVHYQFPAVGKRGPVKLNWYDGGLFPPRPDGLPDDVTSRSRRAAAIFIGDKGVLMHDTYGDNPRLYPNGARWSDAGSVPQSIPRITGGHEMNWVNACKGESKTSSPFEYAARLTETMCSASRRCGPGQGRKVLLRRRGRWSSPTPPTRINS